MHDRKYDNSVENVENYHWLMKNSNETLCSSSEKTDKIMFANIKTFCMVFTVKVVWTKKLKEKYCK